MIFMILLSRSSSYNSKYFIGVGHPYSQSSPANTHNDYDFLINSASGQSLNFNATNFIMLPRNFSRKLRNQSIFAPVSRKSSPMVGKALRKKTALTSDFIGLSSK